MIDLLHSRTRRLLPALALLAAACGGRPPSLDELPPDRSCRTTVVVGPAAESPDPDRWAVEWRLPPDPDDVAQLNAWCAAVGPAISRPADAVPLPTPPAVDTLWLVAWNVFIGGGDLPALVRDLRAGRLTDGAPVEHFVLLLQETFRRGELVPERDPSLPGGGETLTSPPEGPRRDVQEVARALGLSLLYVPSMRNGEHEDRGNAILSTLSLRQPVAVALPVARQRRVAIAAEVAARTSSGSPWRLQVATVHLESQPAWWRSAEGQRLEQAEVLVELLPDADAAVAGGDFNTKARGQEEALVGTLLDAYPDTPPFPTGPTYRKARGLYREYLDYIFVRLPADAGADYRRVARPYGSDHYPLVGRVVW